MRLLFITRKYPPAVGGMENLSFALATEFEKQVYTKKIVWGKSQKWLPYFIPKAFFQALYYIYKYKITNMHFGDGLLAPLALALKTITGIKTSITICGLDITYKNPVYQFIVPRCVSKLDKVICISTATRDECLKRGIPASLCTMIPCGVYPEKFVTNATRNDLDKIIGINTKDKKVLVTVGRLVKRKGVLWFVENILAQLEDNYVYAIIGAGPDKEKIEIAINNLHLNKRAFLLGKLPDEDLKTIYNTADAFVMPNIPVKGDMEGFGIVAIEASSAGLPVIASDLEGIKDAVINGRTGFLTKEESVSDFIKVIKEANTLNKQEIKKIVNTNYSWNHLVNKYLASINQYV